MLHEIDRLSDCERSNKREEYSNNRRASVSVRCSAHAFRNFRYRLSSNLAKISLPSFEVQQPEPREEAEGDLRDRGSGRLRDAFAARRNHPVFIAGLARGIYEKFVLNAGLPTAVQEEPFFFNGERRETGVRLPCKGDSVIRGNRVQSEHGRRRSIIRDLRLRRRARSARVTAVTFHDAAEDFACGLALQELRFAVAHHENLIDAFRVGHTPGRRELAVLDIRRIVIVHEHHRRVTARGEAFDFDDREETVRWFRRS